MASRRSAPLRAVVDGECRAADKSVAEAAKVGTKRELLVAMRDRVAEQITKSDCPPRELGVLTKRLQDIVRDIEQLDAVELEHSKPYDGSNTYDTSVI